MGLEGTLLVLVHTASLSLSLVILARVDVLSLQTKKLVMRALILSSEG